MWRAFAHPCQGVLKSFASERETASSIERSKWSSPLSDHDFATTFENVPRENAVYSHIVTCLPALICLVIVLRVPVLSTEVC